MENGVWVSWTLTQRLESRKEIFLLEPLFENFHAKKASEAISE